MVQKKTKLLEYSQFYLRFIFLISHYIVTLCFHLYLCCIYSLSFPLFYAQCLQSLTQALHLYALRESPQRVNAQHFDCKLGGSGTVFIVQR